MQEMQECEEGGQLMNLKGCLKNKNNSRHDDSSLCACQTHECPDNTKQVSSLVSDHPSSKYIQSDAWQ